MAISFEQPRMSEMRVAVKVVKNLVALVDVKTAVVVRGRGEEPVGVSHSHSDDVGAKAEGPAAYGDEWRAQVVYYGIIFMMVAS
jgi:hypothetical protein